MNIAGSALDHIVTVDFETYYASDYSLTKLRTRDYILDPRYQTILCCVKVDDQPPETHIGHYAVAQRLGQFDWARCAFLAHNTRFDGAIAAWRYGAQPALWLDTMGMARAITHPVLGKSSLKAVSEYLGLPPKGDEVVRALGKRLEYFTPNDLSAYAEYCARDTDNCRLVFDRLRPVMPDSELSLIDLLLRMYVEPQVVMDPHVLAEHLGELRARKAEVLAQVAHLDKKVFSSNPQFAKLLEEHGVEVPRKISPTTGEETWALSKSDREFRELLEDDEQPLMVQALLAARVNSKSTIEETRSETLLAQALCEWPTGRGWAPVPLKYYGAHTGRPSGDEKVNWTNFPRGSRIREAIKAPAGYRIVHRDSSQIEARMVSFLAGCNTLLDAFADPKRDPYLEFAIERVYHRPLTKKDNPKERFVGKTSILQLGYGAGPLKFRHSLFIGNGGISVKIDEEEAKRIVYACYREVFHEIPAFWGCCDWAIQDLLTLSAASRSPRRLTHTTRHEGTMLRIVKLGYQAIWLPNDMCLSYPNIRVERRSNPVSQGYKLVSSGAEIGYDDPYGQFKKLYGGKLTENLCQALARIIITDAAERVYNQTGYHPWLTTYDSLDYCVPEGDAEWMDALLEQEFAIRPSWALGLPLASEGGWGVSLADAEKRVNL